MNNPSNVDGVRWFVRHVLSELRRRAPHIRLRVAGGWEGDGLERLGLSTLLTEENGVDLLGYVDDLAAELGRARIFVVPVQWATGILTKQTLAHVHGLPTVATPVAAQHAAPAPIDVRGRALVWSHRLGKHVSSRVALVAASSADFVRAALELYRNASLWEELSLNGGRFARSGGGKGVCPSGLLEDLNSFWRKLTVTTCSV